jgi:hypothetical protein
LVAEAFTTGAITKNRDRAAFVLCYYADSVVVCRYSIALYDAYGKQPAASSHVNQEEAGMGTLATTWRSFYTCILKLPAKSNQDLYYDV